MLPTLMDFIGMLHSGVNMSLDVHGMNASEVLNLSLATSEGPGVSELVLQNYSHLDPEELKRIIAGGKGKVSLSPHAATLGRQARI